MIYRKSIFVFIFLFLVNCAKEEISLEEDLSIRFDKAMDFFDRGKYSRSKDELDYIIMIDPGSKLANESQYYVAESMFLMEEYAESSKMYDRYVRFSPDFLKVEHSRYRICECAIKLSNPYQRDQTQTKNAIEQLQMFIEDFPDSEKIYEAEVAISELRFKLAQKDYESGRMYLKLEEYESASIYFQSVLNEYYDTLFADEARIAIIFKHILNDNFNGAQNFFNSQKESFLSLEKLKEAEQLLNSTQKGLKFAHYYKLYR